MRLLAGLLVAIATVAAAVVTSAQAQVQVPRNAPVEAVDDTMAHNNPCRDCAYRYCPSPEYAKPFKDFYKRRARADGVPERLLVYYDQLPDCIQCIEGGAWPKLQWEVDPDKYQAAFGTPPTSTGASMSWDAFSEKNIRDLMRRGVVARYRVLLLTQPCRCCPEGMGRAAVESWSEDFHDLERLRRLGPGLGVYYNSRDDLGPEPDDLVKVAAKDFAMPIDTKPPLRDAHPACSDCQAKADVYNTAFGAYRDSFDDIIELQKTIRALGLKAQAVAKEMLEQGGKERLNAPLGSASDNLFVQLGRLIEEIARFQRKLDLLLKRRAGLQRTSDEAMAALLACNDTCDKKPGAAPAPLQLDALTPVDCDGAPAPPEQTTRHAACRALAEKFTARRRESECARAKWAMAIRADAERLAKIRGQSPGSVVVQGPVTPEAISRIQEEARKAQDRLSPPDRLRYAETAKRDYNEQIRPLGTEYYDALHRMMQASAEFANCEAHEKYKEDKAKLEASGSKAIPVPPPMRPIPPDPGPNPYRNAPPLK